MSEHWIHDAVFYHIYPLGFSGAPARNDFCSAPEPRLNKITQWLDHIQTLGANALYLGPVFESTKHGYDTANYFELDRRLGTNQTLSDLSAELHRRGMRLVLDGVFNHVGRDFWAFRDVQAHGPQSAYCDWFSGLRFDQSSPRGDPFNYDTWNNHHSLVKLNLEHPAVIEHLFAAVTMWIDTFQIDGLRLDAADCISLEFLKQLAALCRRQRSDFWLMGEVVHGDYRRWANAEILDSVTNYECYKGLYSSHVDRNYFEIAYALNRQFGSKGLYTDLALYNFVDNHDVDRVASRLTNPTHLYPLYCLLFTMPGVPSIYYGSEWGIPGRKQRGSDQALRPNLHLDDLWHNGSHPALRESIARLASIRRSLPALRHGDYRQLFIDHEQLVFARQTPHDSVIVAVNASSKAATLEVELPSPHGVHAVDVLNGNRVFPIQNGRVRLTPLWPHWASILTVA